MSWSIKKAGTKADVLDYVRQSEAEEPEDQPAHDLAKEILSDVLEHGPEDSDTHAEAGGHAAEKGSSFKVEVRHGRSASQKPGPRYLDKKSPSPVPVPTAALNNPAGKPTPKETRSEQPV